METRESALIPILGHTYEINFGRVIFHNTFDSETRLTYQPVRGGLGQTQTVEYRSVQIHPNAYFQYWQEHDHTTVTRYIDFEKLVVHGNITLPDSTFLTLQGTLRRIE